MPPPPGKINLQGAKKQGNRATYGGRSYAFFCPHIPDLRSFSAITAAEELASTVVAEELASTTAAEELASTIAAEELVPNPCLWLRHA